MAIVNRYIHIPGVGIRIVHGKHDNAVITMEGWSHIHDMIVYGVFEGLDIQTGGSSPCYTGLDENDTA